MTLGQLIHHLEGCDPTLVAPIGLGEPCSYRGVYDELAFVARRDISFGAMLRHAQSALDQEFDGYKGGTYRMGVFTHVHLVEDSSQCGEDIGPVLLDYMVRVAETYMAARP